MHIKQLGLTLVELMVTIAIAAIMLTMGVPSLTSMYESYRAESNIRTIQQAILFSRNHALSYGSRVTLCPLNGNTCSNDWINGASVFIDNGTINTIDGTDQVLLELASFNDNDFIDYDQNSITIGNDGFVSGGFSSGSFNYCPGSQTSTDSKGLTLSISGKVKFTSGTIVCN
ncbi:type IV minor pilin protein FimT [Shewanella sairae]|uniref:Type II secretion system protein H n=1 Tax=Shewanella sairae TaxID=190310 RepID=A0ABQ4PE79_9GAMM|nr:GspH/FimT family pseudopilin [Shewanella sairae]MCL1128659.1 GspH/FimT family pseudopilin [Shewanella sairae]GIU45855.1 type IV minor pilin protein FimT [Shewanella sairae]